MAKGCALSTGYLPQGGLPRNSVDRLTDRPYMTSAVDRGHKASTQTKTKLFIGLHMMCPQPIRVQDFCKKKYNILYLGSLPNVLKKLIKKCDNFDFGAFS